MNASMKLAALAIFGCCLTVGSASAQLGSLTNGNLDPFNKNNKLPWYVKLPGGKPNSTSKFGVEEPGKVGQGVFRYTAGMFVPLNEGRWVERRDNGPESYFTETTRNDSYVELYDSSRNMSVRLYANYGLHFQAATNRWVRWPGSNGDWR